MAASERKQREVAARRERVLAKRAAGLTYREIAEQEGLSSPQAAVIDAQWALKGRAVERLREGDPVTMELERIDGLERAAHQVMRDVAGHNPDLVLRAVDHLTRLSGRRSALLRLGTRAPAEKRAPSGIDEIAAKRRQRRAAQGW